MSAFGTNVQLITDLLPTSIAGSSSFVSPVFGVPGPGLSAGVLMNQTGNITLQRYLDAAGLLPIGSAVTAAITANTVATIQVNDGTPYIYATLTIQNTAVTTSTVSLAMVVCSQTGH